MLTRLRSRGSLTESCLWLQSYYPHSCASRTTDQYSGYTANIYLGDRVVTTDVVTPNFWKRKKAGEIILNNYSNFHYRNQVFGSSSVTMTTVAVSCTSPNIYSIDTRSAGFFCYMLRNYGSIPEIVSIIQPVDIGNLIEEVWTECVANRGSGKQNYTESLAEADQAFELVHAPLQNVITFVRDFRRHGKRKKGYAKVAYQSYDLIKFVSSEYLRFRYGISPLMSDVKAGMKALKESFDKKPILHKTRSSGMMFKQAITNSSFTASPFNVTYTKSAVHDVSIRAVYYDMYKRTIFDELGLTFHNVVGVAWELTHYSFVVDWFANVGNLIYANIPRVGIEPKGGCTTYVEHRKTIWSPQGYTNIAPTVFTIAGSLGDFLQYETTSKIRNVRNDSGTLVIKNDFRFDHYTRCLDASALLSQLLGSIAFG